MYKNTLIPTSDMEQSLRLLLFYYDPPWYLRLAALEACTVMLLEVIYGWDFGPWKTEDVVRWEARKRNVVDWFLKKIGNGEHL